MYSVRISIHYATGTTNDALSEVGTLPQRNVCLIFSSTTNGKEMFYLSSPSRRRVGVVVVVVVIVVVELIGVVEME